MSDKTTVYQRPKRNKATPRKAGRPRKTAKRVDGEARERSRLRVLPRPGVQGTVLEGVRQKVFLDRYALKDESGNPIEEYPEQMWRRVARGIAQAEKTKKLRQEWEEKFYRAMEDFRFVPGGRILSGAGTGFGVTFYNCYVLPSPHDSRGGIMENLREMVDIMATGGGVGVNLSSLRPRGSRVKKVNGFSSGPTNWAELYSVATHDIIQQGGCFAPDTRIMTHRGLIPVSDIVESKGNFFAATHQGHQKITAKFNNGEKTLYEVKTKAGYKVKVTAEHKLVTFNNNGEIYLKPLKDFKEGEGVVLLLGEWMADLPYAILNSRLPASSKFSSGLKEIRLPERLDEDLAFILGVYAADGSRIPDEYSPNGKGIRFAVARDREKDLQTLIGALRRVFGVEPKVGDGDGAVKNVHIFSRRLNEFLALNNLLKESSVKVRVPEPIFISPKGVVEAYISGVFMGDGTNRGGKGGLRIATVSEKFAQELQLLLLNLGIPSKIRVRKRRHEGWKTLYTVTVNGARFMRRFVKVLAPYTEKVFDRKASVRDGTFGWPFNLVDRFAYIPHFQTTMARTNPTTSQKAVLFLQEKTPILAEEDRPDVEVLTNCVPDTIASITPLGRSVVYDLEVDRVHRLSGNGFYTSNSRRGALMLMLWDWHPDIEEFITVKRDLSRIVGANLSVCVSDRFMRAIKNNEDWALLFPDLDDPDYDEVWDGIIENWIEAGKKVKVHKTIKARKLWDLICQAAWESAEPGTVFMERYNKWHNNWYFNKINCVNPCGEEGLPEYGVCNLGSLNLSAFVDEKGEMDYQSLAEHAKLASRFLDNVIDSDIYLFEGIRETQLNGERRFGLGTMGLGDALIKMKTRYGSKESIPKIEKIYRTIRDASYQASVELAREKGSFPKFDAKPYLKSYFVKKLPPRIRRGIKKYGIRNSVLLMQAPTGSTSLLSGTTSGIEPVYEFSFIRRDRLGEHRIYHPLYDEWRERHPDQDPPPYFVSANDLTPKDHVRVQAAVQKYVDASISKTVNAPKTHTVEDVKKLYTLAYELGCKGITYMREGSRPGVLSREEKSPAPAKEETATPQPAKEATAPSQKGGPLTPRPAKVSGSTYRVKTPVGSAFVTINEEDGEPLEVFINVGKAGSDVTAMAEALGRLVSTSLRLQGNSSRRDRVKEIVAQLTGIGGRRSVGFGQNKVRSLPDAVALALATHYGIPLNGNGPELKAGADMAAPDPDPTPAPAGFDNSPGTSDPPGNSEAGKANLEPTPASFESLGADLCPACGSNTLVFEEGCAKCYACGHAEC